MFEQTFVDGSGRKRRTWTMLVALFLQFIAIIIILIIPLVFTGTLTMVRLTNLLVAPAPPSAPAPPASPPEQVAPRVAKKVPPRQFDDGILLIPKRVPKDVVIIKEDELLSSTHTSSSVIVGSVPCGQSGLPPCGNGPGVPFGFGPPTTLPPPPAPVVKESAKPIKPIERLVVGGKVQEGKCLSCPKPIYPPLARQARVFGVVRLKAIIGKDGTIKNLVAINGHPLLVSATMEAVGRWTYRPTLLNDNPVEVATDIEVNFVLGQ